MKRALKKAAILVAAMSTIMAAGACGSGESGQGNADDLTVLRVAVNSGISSLPVKIAMENGIFEENGLAIELTEGSDVPAWQAAVGKQFDIVVTSPANYGPSVAKGLDNTVLYNMTQSGEGYLSIPIVSRDPITKFADLEGKTIGATALTGTSPDGLKYLLSEAGLSPDSIKLIQLPYSAHPDNLKAGNVDAVLSANPYFPGLAEDGFHVFPEDVPAAAMAAVTNGKSKTASPLMFCANTVWVEKNADVVNAWVKSVQEAAKFSNENKEEARAILTQWLNFSDDLAAQVIIPDFEEEVDAELIETHMLGTWDILKNNGGVQGEFPLDKLKIHK